MIDAFTGALLTLHSFELLSQVKWLSAVSQQMSIVSREVAIRDGRMSDYVG